MSFEIGVNHPLVLGATFENVYLALWWHDLEVKSIAAVREHRQEFMRRRAGPLYTYDMVFFPKLKPISKDLRAELGQFLEESKGRFFGNALFIQGTNPLLHGAVRLLALGLRFVVRNQSPLEFFSSSQDAVNWLAPLAKVDSNALQVAIARAMKSTSIKTISRMSFVVC